MSVFGRTSAFSFTASGINPTAGNGNGGIPPAEPSESTGTSKSSSSGFSFVQAGSSRNGGSASSLAPPIPAQTAGAFSFTHSTATAQPRSVSARADFRQNPSKFSFLKKSSNISKTFASTAQRQPNSIASSSVFADGASSSSTAPVSSSTYQHNSYQDDTIENGDLYAAMPTTNFDGQQKINQTARHIANPGKSFASPANGFAPTNGHAFGITRSGPQENRYMELKDGRDDLKQSFIAAGKMQDSETKVHLDDAIDFVGECLDMCPEFERHEREYQNALADFEKIPGTNKVDHSRAVKRYRRSAAGDPEPMPCDVRPPYILVRTLDYLFHNVLREHGLEGSYAFVRDRARSIRTDFTLQNYRKMEAVECHERIARYHIICAFKFCNHATISLQQEQEQMRKTLQSLREYYKDLAVQGIFSPNEPEFQAYYILSHMWQSEIVTNAEVQLRPEVFSHPQVQLAIELQQLAQCGSDKRKTEMSGTMNFFSRFFRLIESQSTSYLIACLLHQEFVPIRRAALRVMHLKSHYSLGPYPIADLIQPLGLDDEEDVRYNLEYYGIDCEEIDGILVAAIGKDKRPGGRVNPIFNDGQKKSLEPRISYRLVESKAAGVDIVDFIDGVDVGPPKPVPKAAYSVGEVLVQPFTPSRATNDVSTIRLSNGTPTSAKPITAIQHTVETPVAKPEKKTSLGFSASSILTPLTFVTSYFGQSKSPEKQAPELIQDSSANSTGVFPAPSFLPSFLPGPKRSSSTSSLAPQKPNSSESLKPAVQVPPVTTTLFGNLNGGSPLPPSIGNLNRVSSPLPLTPMKESPAKSQPLFFAAPPRLESPRPLDQFPKLLMQKQSSTTDSFPKALPVKEEFAVDLVTELVEEEVVSVVLSFLFEDNYARVFAERLEEETLYELCEELVKEVFTEIRQERKQEVLAAARHDAMTHQSRFFRRWLENAVRKAKVKQRELEKRQEKAVRYYLSVLGSDFASYHHSPATPRNMSRILGKDAITGFVDNGWGTGALTDFEGLLLQNIQEGSQRYDSFFRSIDVPNVILLPLMKVNNNNQASRLRHILWKLIISTPYDLQNADIAGNQPQQDKFASMWTRSKFGMDSQLDSVSTETRGLTTEIVLRKSVETLVGTHPGQREKCRISCLVQHASVYVDEFDAEDDLLDRAKNRRAHNSEAPFSGSHALLFQLSLFVSSDSSTWWRNERLRLLSFVSYLPIGSRVPLLLLYWCNGELSREEFMSQVAFRLDLPSLLADDGGPIVAIDLKVIEASSNDFNHEAASLAFTSGLRWLAESTVPDPILGSDIIRDVIETFTADPVRFALEKIDKLIPFDANFALDTECISKTWNVFVDIFNLQLEAINRILASEENYSTPWPAKEFSINGDFLTPPMLWNHDTTLLHLGGILERFKLPHIDQLQGTDMDDDMGSLPYLTEAGPVRRLFEVYTTKVSGLLDALSQALNTPSLQSLPLPTSSASTILVSTVWTRLASFEKSLMFRFKPSSDDGNFRQGRRQGVMGSGNGLFPFSRLALAFASSTLSALEEALGKFAKEVAVSSDWLGAGGDRSATKTNRSNTLVRYAWYLKSLVDSNLQGFTSKVNEIVLRWETDVRSPWMESEALKAEMQIRKADAMDDDLPQSADGDYNDLGSESGAIDDGSSANFPWKGYPDGSEYTNHRDISSSPFKSSRYTSSTLHTPIRSPDVLSTSAGSKPITASASPAAGDSQYTRLKRRLSEAIRSSREEMEVTKRRLAEPSDF